MKQVTHLQKATIRFRRWSRGRYATFASLSRNISIGRLSVGICDASLVKQSCVCKQQLSVEKEELVAEEETLQEALPVLQQEMIFTVNEVSGAAAQALVANAYDMNGYKRTSSCSRSCIV